jgi:3-oxoacyl-[acyl-carrier-protein] synthase-3/clorobiocin biosynthesis protein CloN2
LRTPDIFISGLGVFLPDVVSVGSAVEQGLYPADLAESTGLTGVAVGGDIPAPEMALRAAQDAFKRCGRRPEEVDLLLYADAWHQGPDGWQPQYYLQRHLVGGEALAVEIRHGCNGMFSAFELAASYLYADPRRQAALLVAADNFGTPLVDRWRTGPGFILGDGASAAVITREPGFAELLSVRTVTIPELEELHRVGEPQFPPGITTGRVLDMTARAEAFKRVAAAQPDLMDAWLKLYRRMLEVIGPTLAEAGVEIGDIARVAFTNASRETTEQRWMGALGLPLALSTWEYGRTLGHLGVSDQLVSLDHLLATGELRAGDLMLMAGIGPGITLSSAIVKIRSTPPWIG